MRLSIVIQLLELNKNNPCDYIYYVIELTISNYSMKILYHLV